MVRQVRHQEVLFGVTGQSLWFSPPELARASAPTATVYRLGSGDDGPTESATTGAASIDSVDTTLDAAAAPGDNTLTLASGASVARGGRYLLTSSIGLSEHVDVLAVSGSIITLQRPLVNDYAAGATFQGTRVSIALSPTWVADRSKLSDIGDGYRVRWTYTIDSSPVLAVTYFDLVRYSARHLVTGQDVDNRFPGWIDRLPPDHRENQGASLIDAAFEAVKLDALGDAQIIRRLRDTQIVRELTIVKANLIAIENQVYAGSSNLDGLTTARDVYAQRYQQLLREPKAPSDGAGGGAATGSAARLPVWRR